MESGGLGLFFLNFLDPRRDEDKNIFYHHFRKVTKEVPTFHTITKDTLEAYLNKTCSTQIHNVVFFKCWRTILFELQVVHYAARIDL